MQPFHTYPAEIEEKEAEAVEMRRAYAAGGKPAGVAKRLPEDTLGLALSGGGIRSATFNLGILQALAGARVLRQVDLLSTISGGGYIGSFLGRFFDRLRKWPVLPMNVVESALCDPQSPEMQWLRQHGNYIAPSGQTDVKSNFAVFVRNLLTVYFVVGLLLFGLFGLANIVRYGLLESVSALLPYIATFNWNDMPIGRLVSAAGLSAFWSPWFMLCEFVILLFVLPQAFGYWLASQEKAERFNAPALVACFLLMGTFFYLGVRDGLYVPAVLGALPFLISLLVVENTWWTVRRKNAAVGTGGVSIERLRARNYLTRDLGLWLGIAGTFLGFALIDSGAHAIYEAYIRGNPSYLKAIARITAGVAALAPVLQFIARMVSHKESARKNPTSKTRWLSHPAVSGAIALILITPPLVLVSLFSHVAFQGGQALLVGILATAFALLLSIIFASPKAVPFINRSSLNQTYAARLARAYLGASNPLRFASHTSPGRNIDEVMPGDDAECFQDYRPFEAGGPLHIIGTCINETVDQITLREARDRNGLILAVTPMALSVGRYWHALWSGDSAEIVGHLPGTVHPLLAANGRALCRLEPMNLRQWISISGAAFGSGMGQQTNKTAAFLFTLGNLRTGYWWDTGLSTAHRGMRPQVSFLRRFLWLLPRFFLTQSQLLHEALAQFPGPWARYWYLSDGGHFENLGAYELIRRKVRFMMVTDAGADPDYDFDDFANLQRKVRIDFQADLALFTDADWHDAIVRRAGADQGKQEAWTRYFEPIRQQLGRPGPHGETFFDLTPKINSRGEVTEPAKRCAALFKVTYRDGSRPSLLLYIKACQLGDETADVREYSIANPDFPHQSTADQFFDESQWESYRQLGEHLAGRLFRAGPEPEGAGLGMWLGRLG